MTITHTTGVRMVDDAPLEHSDPAVQARIDRVGAVAALREFTEPTRTSLAAHIADPMAADSRAAYVGWLRRQATAWAGLALPTVPVAALEWPLASVRPQCLDVVGLLLADLRELSPGSRPMTVPRQASWHESIVPGICVASAYACTAAAQLASGLLEPALTLTAGMTRVGPATRYLQRCAELTERLDGFHREVDRWAAAAPATQVQVAAVTAQQQLGRLLQLLEAGRRTGW
jgi:hypothetical protein